MFHRSASLSFVLRYGDINSPSVANVLMSPVRTTDWESIRLNYSAFYIIVHNSIRSEYIINYM